MSNFLFYPNFRMLKNNCVCVYTLKNLMSTINSDNLNETVCNSFKVNLFGVQGAFSVEE